MPPVVARPKLRKWFLRGQVGLSQVFSEVGGQMQPGGWITGDTECHSRSGGGSQTGQPAAVRRHGKVMHWFISQPPNRASVFLSACGSVWRGSVAQDGLW